MVPLSITTKLQKSPGKPYKTLNEPTPKTDLNKDLAVAVEQSLKDLEYDATKRNTYISTREDYLYGNGLYSKIDFEVGQWFAEYNYLLRVIDIHASQLMGRPFNVYSYYDKKDLTPVEGKPDELEIAKLENAKAKANADTRKRVVDAIIRDNGGFAKFKDGARIGSAFGNTVYKMWFDKEQNRIRITLIESPQNYRAGWTDSDFRERDFDAYIWQISESRAYRDHGSILGENETFATSKFGQPLELVETTREAESDRKMVTVTEFNGYLQGWAGKKGKMVRVKRGEETPVNLMLVGGHVAQIITDEGELPSYYIINNRQEPRAAWGKSDLPQSALDINQEIVQLQADMMTWANKNLFKLIQAKGFTPDGIPKKKPRKMQVVAMSQEQSLEEMQVNNQSLSEFQHLLEQKMDAFVRITGVGRVLFDDPQTNTNSNQALITTLKPVIDIVEDKQSRWEPVLAEMFTDALKLSAKYLKELKDAVLDDENWFLCIEWPSVLRREDSAYQSMWLNRLNASTISLETYMEKMGDDYSEEIDRLTDEMQNKVPAAILGKMLGALAQNIISPPSNTPTPPPVKYNVNVKADATLDQLTNDGVITEVMGAGEYQPAPEAASQPQQPEVGGQITSPDQNSEGSQPMSQPGTGQPPVSPEGAVAQQAQNLGA